MTERDWVVQYCLSTSWRGWEPGSSSISEAIFLSSPSLVLVLKGCRGPGESLVFSPHWSLMSANNGNSNRGRHIHQQEMQAGNQCRCFLRSPCIWATHPTGATHCVEEGSSKLILPGNALTHFHVSQFVPDSIKLTIKINHHSYHS